MKFRIFLITIVIIVSWACFKISTRTNTIWAISYNHGIQVPTSTTDIKFDSYLWLLNFGIDGNGSLVHCIMNQDEFEEFLKTQRWCNKCRGIGRFSEFPDSLIGKYPMTNVELKSKIADTLLVSAHQLKEENKVKVSFYTDNN